MSTRAKKKIFIKELSPNKGEVLRNLNIKIPSNLLTKLRFKANHEGTFVKYYLLSVIKDAVADVEVKVK